MMMSTQPLMFLKAQTITGQYYLHGVMETASGFKFNADLTFAFFYSYGAIDRAGSGTYTIKDNHVILNSIGRNEKDFKLIKSKHNSYDGVTIKITDANAMARKYVSCSIATAEGMQRAQTNEDGIAQFQKQQADSIILIHLLFPDRPSIFQITGKSDNYFEFTIEPTIVNVYFHNLTLKISEVELTGGHPLIEGDQFHYEKEE